MEGAPKKENSNEDAIEKLQNLAVKFKSGEITEEEKVIFEQLADDYIDKNGTGDYGYYSDGPSQGMSFMEYGFYDLPNNLCLVGEAGNHQNTFRFGGEALTVEERKERIAYLKSTHNSSKEKTS